MLNRKRRRAEAVASQLNDGNGEGEKEAEAGVMWGDRGTVERKERVSKIENRHYWTVHQHALALIRILQDK